MNSALEESHAERQLQIKPASQFDRLVLVIAAIEPLTTLPQIYQIWVEHQTAGVSIFTWLLYASTECIWVIYGIRNKDKPVIIASILWVVMEALVVIGVLFR